MWPNIGKWKGEIKCIHIPVTVIMCLQHTVCDKRALRGSVWRCFYLTGDKNLKGKRHKLKRTLNVVTQKNMGWKAIQPEMISTIHLTNILSGDKSIFHLPLLFSACRWKKEAPSITLKLQRKVGEKKDQQAVIRTSSKKSSSTKVASFFFFLDSSGITHTTSGRSASQQKENK